jgi:hypothetical protein
MSRQQSTQGNSQAAGAGSSHHDDATIGVGNDTSGEAGSTPTHETMAETGGSGGEGLTGNQVEEGSRQAGAAENRQGEQGQGADTVDSGKRGFQDTRSRQAGGSETGLGTPETGANQTPGDLEHDPDARSPDWFRDSGQGRQG